MNEHAQKSLHLLLLVIFFIKNANEKNSSSTMEKSHDKCQAMMRCLSVKFVVNEALFYCFDSLSFGKLINDSMAQLWVCVRACFVHSLLYCWWRKFVFFRIFFIEHAKRINKNEKKNAFKESARVNVEKKPTSGINIRVYTSQFMSNVPQMPFNVVHTNKLKL